MLNRFIQFLKGLKDNRELLKTLILRDVRSRYTGSVLGVLWAFIQPLSTILIIWFVFHFGLKVKPNSQGVPFPLWLLSAMTVWFFFSDCFSSATQSILEQASIVKKVVFRISLLPLVKIGSGLIIHMFFIFVLFIVAFVYGYYPRAQWLQLPYFLLCTLFLLIGISWIASSVVVFFRDLGQFINMGLQLAFWGTPIFWEASLIPTKYQFILKVNPVYYLTEGYRSVFCSDIWFWEKEGWTLWFWFVSFVFFFFGAICFQKLKPHFADVL